MKAHTSHGFTLIEMIGVIVLVGIFTALAGIGVSNMYRAGLDRKAMGKAEGINQAQLTYKLRVANAGTTWSNASSGSDRFLLVRGYVPYGATATLATYQPDGYTFTLGSSLDSRVAITGPNGAIDY